MTRTDEAAEAFAELVQIMDRLRSPGGCRWDGEQTHESLVRYLIEESYEVVEAIEAPDGVDRALLREELGDVLLQVVFHSRVADEVPAEAGGFDVADVIRGLNQKLIRRHPHVFAASEGEAGDVVDPADLTRRWDELKRIEKPERTGPFDGIPPALPALALAEKTVSKAAKASLPLPPESAEAEESADDQERIGRELLGLVVQARRLGVDPEKALRGEVRRYAAAADDGA